MTFFPFPSRTPTPSLLGIGDVVRLRSGGPDMLVVDLCERYVTAAWPDGEAEWAPGTLVLVRKAGK